MELALVLLLAHAPRSRGMSFPWLGGKGAGGGKGSANPFGAALDQLVRRPALERFVTQRLGPEVPVTFAEEAQRAEAAPAATSAALWRWAASLSMASGRYWWPLP